jgi:cytoskeletal protein CcmA (bactofilin family)
MASSYTDLGIEKMATGENAGTWGTKTNTNLDIIEKSIAGYVEQAVTSGGTTALTITDGDATESTSVARHAVIKLTGTITGNSIVTVPDSVEKVYIVTNGTSGAYTVQFKTASGTGITFGVSEKTTRLVYSDGTNLVDAGFGGATDMEGRELVLDADGDTTITADTDDQIDIKISGADDFQFTANTFTAQSGSTIAAQALTATTVTASGIVKTDDTTEATSTTDGSLQTDGGLSVAKDAVIGDDLKLLSDSAVLSFGADSDTTLTHTDGTGLTLNSTNKLLFRDTGLYINSSTDGQLDLVADTEIQIAATTIDINGAIAMDGAITGATNITLSGELDAATLDISGNADIDGTLEADAITINGTAIGSIYGAVAGSSSIVTTGALDSGSITSGFGTIDTGSSAITTTGLISGGSLDIDDVLINGTTIGHTDDTDLITLADGVATVAGEISVTTLDIGGTNVTATAAEINLIDGGTARGTTAVADGDGLLVNDGGTMRMTNVTTLKTYFTSGTSSAADDITAGDAAVSITTSSGDITIDAAANDSDIIFKGTDNSSDITMLTLDGSEAGAATFNNKVVATELDISGNCDIDGTTNLDAVDIDGAVQLDATLTIGANDQGYDVILYGDTASANITWDTSADDLIFNGAAGLIVPDGQLTLGSTAVSSTAAELNLLDGVSGLVQADFTKLAAVDSTAAELNIVDGGTSATSTTLVDADRVVVNDNGTMVQVAMTDVKTYIGGGTSWQAVKTGNYTASAGQGVFVNTTSAAITITLPAGTIGDEITIVDYAGTFDSNACTVAANGSEKIFGSTDDLTVSTERAAFTLVFTDSTQGWLFKND